MAEVHLTQGEKGRFDVIHLRPGRQGLGTRRWKFGRGFRPLRIHLS
jgi:hypothetical protein